MGAYITLEVTQETCPCLRGGLGISPYTSAQILSFFAAYACYIFKTDIYLKIHF